MFVIAVIWLRELSPQLRDQLMVTIRDRALIEARAKGISEADIAQARGLGDERVDVTWCRCSPAVSTAPRWPSRPPPAIPQLGVAEPGTPGILAPVPTTASAAPWASTDARSMSTTLRGRASSLMCS